MDRVDRPSTGSMRVADPRTAAAEAWQMLSGIIQASQLIPREQRAAPGSLPLTIIGGFLGAGKTTLLNRLLTEPHGRKIAVLVNDFGRINIDAALIRSRTGGIISLANGCACCSVATDLTRILVELAQRAEPPDAIVLEASGLADPLGIAQVALTNPALRLDGILAVVDAETICVRAADLESGATFHAQISAADLVVLNKLDLLDETGQRTAHAWLADQAPGKPVVNAIRAEIPAEIVLGIHSTREPPAEFAVSAVHTSCFRNWSASTDVLLDGERIRTMMRDLPTGILRAKGILWLSDDPTHRTVFQRVGPRSSYVAENWDDETPHSSLVVIGPADAIDSNGLSRQFDASRAG